MVDGKRFAGQGCESGAGIGEGVYANAEPGYAVTAGDADEAEQENDGEGEGDGFAGDGLEPAEIQSDDYGDEYPQEQDELSLRDQVSFAGLVDEFGDFAHGAMNGQVLEAHVDDHAEAEAEDAEQNADEKEAVSVDGAVQEADGGKVRKFERSFAAGFAGGLSDSGCGTEGEQSSQGKGLA